MKGDFSQWRFNPEENFTGVLQQQGKVMLDSDWNEHARIGTHWQDQAGQDAIGPDVAAVPTEAPDGFKVLAARIVSVGGDPVVEVDLHPGRIWADGILAYLAPNDPAAPTDPVARIATHLAPPIQDPAAGPPSAAEGAAAVRDAVVLEVWRETLHGFQLPQRLLEPALGGVDTTERILTSYALRLLRLEDGEDCHSIHDKLKDDPSGFGRLTATLTPTTTVAGECPVTQGGGYVGLEHRLYRIEIAATDDGTPRFKWSHWNGGLVGAGVYHTSGTDITIDIEANRTAILTSGLTSCYLEAVTYDEALGHWRVSYGTPATINPNGTIEIDTSQALFGTPPPDPSADPTDDPRSFFRLWNGIELLGDYLNAATPEELPDELGVHLAFEEPSTHVYRPGDYWTFTVRAGDIGNSDTLLDAATPAGIRYHRVPLGIVTWTADLDTSDGGDLHDCRRRFRPLSRLDTCCTHRVGDGHTSLGDYDSIQEAIDALPDEGGEVCILPGEFHENIVLLNRTNVTISGCGARTRLLAPDADQTDAVITILGGQQIAIESLAVEAAPRGRGVLALGQNPFDKADTIPGPIRGLSLQELHVTAAGFAAVRAEWIQGLSVRACELHMEDVHCEEQALLVLADDARIERNLVEVANPDGAGSASPEEDSSFMPGNHSKGGIHLKGLCERVRVEDNRIRGGSGNGITLGSIIWIDEDGEPVDPEDQPDPEEEDPCAPTRPVDTSIPGNLVDAGEGQARRASGGPLYQVHLGKNRISSMGTNGIAVAGFFDLSGLDEFISVVGLHIRGNHIHDCLRRSILAPTDAMAADMGYGGIALGDVEDLVIRENTIVDNGPTHIDPICGIFILHVQAADVAGNRIVNNGARSAPATGAAVKNGQRGGIVIRYATPLTIVVDTLLGSGPQQNGVPAVRLHDNVVSSPFGRALSIMALGPVSIVANQLTSRGIPPFSVDITGLFAGAVMIFNLGISNDLLYLQQLLFKPIVGSGGGDYVAGAAADAAAREGLDDARFASLLANGQVIFNDNQVNLDLLARGFSLSFSSILIFTLDDLSFADNQCEANLLDDILITNLLSVAMTQRVSGNRFKEGLFNAPLSAFTLGVMMNTTTDNQGTHCIVVRNAVASLLVDEDNTVLIQAFLKGFCEIFGRFLGGLGGSADTASASGQTIGGPATTPVANSSSSNVIRLIK